jgi:CBS domain-containing protein
LVVGIVTTLDILKSIQEGGGGGGKKLNSILAKDIMTSSPSVVKTDTSIEKLIDIIIEQEIVLVPVVDDNNRIVGVVIRLDIIREKLSEGFITIGKREDYQELEKVFYNTIIYYYDLAFEIIS